MDRLASKRNRQRSIRAHLSLNARQVLTLIELQMDLYLVIYVDAADPVLDWHFGENQWAIPTFSEESGFNAQALLPRDKLQWH